MRRSVIYLGFQCVSCAVLFYLFPAIIVLCDEPAQHPQNEETSPEVFKMEEVSVFDLNDATAIQFQRGQQARKCGIEPLKEVKAYPSFKSKKPFYGKVEFDGSLIRYGVGIDYHFALDEAGGTGKGYDRLYFDANRDLDLTNDVVLSPMKEPAIQQTLSKGRGRNNVAFDYLEFDLDRGPGKRPVPLKIIPQLTIWSSTSPMVSFTLPTVRRGKIRLGSKEFAAVLSQAFMITGGYDRSMAGLHLTKTRRALPFLCGWHELDGTFYTFSATPSGDKLTVTPYTGPFGVLDVVAGDPNVKTARVELGYLVSEDVMIDIGDCPSIDGKLKVPVGEYRPLHLGLRLDDLRVRLVMKMPQTVEAQTKSPKFVIKISEDKPCEINLAGKPDIVFQTPAANERLKVGSEIKVKAAVHDRTMDSSLVALEDSTQKIGQSIKLSNGTEYQRYRSINPTIKIVNSSGKCVAEGKMPFG